MKEVIRSQGKNKEGKAKVSDEDEDPKESSSTREDSDDNESQTTITTPAARKFSKKGQTTATKNPKSGGRPKIQIQSPKATTKNVLKRSPSGSTIATQETEVSSLTWNICRHQRNLIPQRHRAKQRHPKSLRNLSKRYDSSFCLFNIKLLFLSYLRQNIICKTYSCLI